MAYLQTVPMIIHTQTEATRIVNELKRGELDDWTYRSHKQADGIYQIGVYDENNEFVGYIGRPQ